MCIEHLDPNTGETLKLLCPKITSGTTLFLSQICTRSFCPNTHLMSLNPVPQRVKMHLLNFKHPPFSNTAQTQKTPNSSHNQHL